MDPKESIRFENESPMHLLEAKDAEGREWDVCLIQPGWSLNGKYYSPDVLKKAVPLFQDAKAFAYEFSDRVFNHLPKALRNMAGQFIKNLVGWYSNPRYGTFKDQDGKTREGIIARLHVADSADWLKRLLSDAWAHGKELLGFSIDGDGLVSQASKEGRFGDIVDTIRNITSVDVVTQPAAGGEFIRLVASLNLNKGGKTQMDFYKKVFDLLKASKPELVEGIDPENILVEQAIKMMKELIQEKETPELFKERAGFYTEMFDQLITLLSAKKVEDALNLVKDLQAKLKAYGYGYPYAGYGYPYAQKAKEAEAAKEKAAKEAKEKAAQEAKEKKDKEVLKQMDELETKIKIRECAITLSETLQEAKLDKPIQDVIEARFKGKIFEKAELDEAIKSLREAVAKVVEGVPKKDEPHIEMGQDEKDKMQKAMDGFFENKDIDGVPRFRTLKEAYSKIVGVRDFDPQDILKEAYNCGLRESIPSRLRESINTGTWGQILGDSITRKMVKEYAKSDMNVWREIVSDIVPINDFRTNRRMLMGGYGLLPDVAQGDSYVSLSSPGDDEMTYAISKKGGLEDLTLEAVANDDVGAIRRIPVKLGRAAVITLYRGVLDLLKNNTPTMWDTKKLFHVDHNNLDSVELSQGALSNIRKMMMNQVVYGSQGDIDTLGISNLPYRLLVPTSLEEMAFKLTTSLVAIVQNENGTTPNIHSTYGLKPIVVPYWDGSPKDYVAVANPKNVPTIEVGFFQGKEDPELFVQDMQNVGSVFTADKITYKIRHIWGVQALDFRGFYKSAQ